MEELNARVLALEKKLDEVLKLVNVKPISDNLSFVIQKYKKSLVVKNMYPNKNTTMPYKELFKKLGGKWSKNDNFVGWLFVGACKEEGKSINEYSQFIIDEIEKLNIEYGVSFEECYN